METEGCVQTIQYLLKRRAKKRGITIRVKADGQVLVSASLVESLDVIEAFIEKKRNWILKHTQATKARPAPVIHTWAEGDIFPVFGVPHVLKLETGLYLGKNRFQVSALDGTLVVMTSLASITPRQVHDVLVGFYRAQSEQYLKQELPVRAKLMGLEVPVYSVINCHGRWGSCSSKHKLSFSVRMSTVALEQAEYLVLHELAHLVHFNHGPEFKQLLSSQMPDWKTRQKALYGSQGISDLRFLQ